MRRILYTVLLLAFFSSLKIAANSIQDSLRLTRIGNVLEKVIDLDSRYKEPMDISVNNMPVGDFLNNIAKAGELNINVESAGEKRISCHFKQVAVSDIIFFVCKEYDFNLELIGTILSVIPYYPPEIEPLISMDYEPYSKLFSFEFTQAKLVDVVRKFSRASGINVVVPNTLFETRISAYGKDMNADHALQAIAATNGLMIQKKDDAMWLLFRQDMKNTDERRPDYFRMDNLEVDSLGLITAGISRGMIQDIVRDLCRRLDINYFFIDELNQSTGIFVSKVDFNAFLKVLLTGTEFTWRVENGIYMFGKNDRGNILSSVRVIPMKYRTVDKVSEIIPGEMKQGVEIITFPDLNSLIVHGDQRKVIQLVTFLNEIDRSVPLISIDVIILDATDTNAREAGISMGLGTKPTTTTGTLSPGFDFTLGAVSVNKLINSFNGFGSINLGRVSPNFYLSLKLLEEDGKIVIRSTPRLSTLNGHKATLKSGEMKYYKESQTYLTGTQNPIQSESYQWKNVEANLSLDITPYLSLDSCITMQIDLTQSEFTERELEDSPPGTATRSFNSIIKVRNQEIVLLGGIERNLSSRTSKGLPFIARIPILRWIFGSSSKRESIQKLNIFIKPTIIE